MILDVGQLCFIIVHNGGGCDPIKSINLMSKFSTSYVYLMPPYNVIVDIANFCFIWHIMVPIGCLQFTLSPNINGPQRVRTFPFEWKTFWPPINQGAWHIYNSWQYDHIYAILPLLHKIIHLKTLKCIPKLLKYYLYIFCFDCSSSACCSHYCLTQFSCYIMFLHL